jgi:hypothetical protein
VGCAVWIADALMIMVEGLGIQGLRVWGLGVYHAHGSSVEEGEVEGRLLLDAQRRDEQVLAIKNVSLIAAS